MGKTHAYLYGVSGKVGNVVARRGPNGGTVLAQYKAKIKNPQTNAQMAQRIILATVAQAIPLLSPIIDHSFEGFAVGAKSKNEFRRLNMSLLRQYAANDFENTPIAREATCFMTTKGVKALIPNRYQISSGSLSQPRFAIARDTTASKKLAFTFPKLTLPITEIEERDCVTLKDALRQMFGITSTGEQITIVIIQRSGEGFKYIFNNDPAPGWVIPYTSMRAARLVMSNDPADLSTAVVLNEPLDTAKNIMGKVMEVLSSSAKTDLSLLDYINAYLDDDSHYTAALVNDNTALEITFNSALEVDGWSADSDHLGHAYAGGIIRSKYNDNGKWSYSNSFMEIAGLTDDEWKNYGLEWGSAIRAWFTKTLIATNDLFLKEGATANELGESFA